MRKEEIMLEVQDVFRDVFADDSIELDDETDSSSIVEWDSLRHIQIIYAIEAHFNIKLNPEQAIILHNVGEMVDLIAKYI